MFIVICVLVPSANFKDSKENLDFKRGSLGTIIAVLYIAYVW